MLWHEGEHFFNQLITLSHSAKRRLSTASLDATTCVPLCVYLCVSAYVARCGADVVAADVHEGSCKSLVQQLQDIGSRAAFFECDVRDRISVDDVMKEVEK